ncbi:hypothetical protein [Cupriavidus sp.]|uniref:hypothetical protein n=1 Tax=Cupriavidus sp. TaxID=1873897 RepID=UPI00341E5D95
MASVLNCIVLTRYSVGDCHVPFLTKVRASDRHLSSEKVSITRWNHWASGARGRNGLVTLGAVGGAFRMSARIESSAVEHPSNTLNAGPRCSIARMPASDAVAGAIVGERWPTTLNPCFAASAMTAGNVPGVSLTTLTKSAPSAFAWRTSCTATSGCGTAMMVLGIASISGASTLPAALSALSVFALAISAADPAISRKPVMPLAIICGK